MPDLGQHLYIALSHPVQGLGRRAGNFSGAQSSEIPSRQWVFLCRLIIGVDVLFVIPLVMP